MAPETQSTTLGDIAHITKLAGFEYTSHFDYAVGGEVIALRSLNIRNGRLDLSDIHTIPREVSEALPRSQLKNGDIVLGYVGSKLGNLAKIEEDNRFHLAPNVALIRPNEEVNSDYLLQYMQGPYFQARLWAFASSTGQPALSMTNIRKLPVPLRPLKEQKCISDILSTWDRAIETTEKLIANSQAQKKALMQQLLTGKKRLPGFRGEWKATALKDVGETSSGGTPESGVPEYWEGDIAWATPTDITALTSRFINRTERQISKTGLANSSAKLLPPGSLLVCTRATVGKLAIATVPITTNQGFKNIVPSTDYDVTFLYYLLDFFQKRLIRAACGSTFLELSKTDFDKLEFKVPSIDEQKAIGGILATADDEIKALEDTLRKLTIEKSALMQQLLTGKRRVKIEEAAA